MIIILIIIVISLGQILSSYIENTSRANAHTRTHPHARTHARTHERTHARTHAHTHTHTHITAEPFRWRPTMTARSAGDNGRRCFIQINTREGDQVSRGFVFFAYKTLLGRTETRTCDRMCFQTIQTVRDISQDDRARIATCSLLTSTDLRRIIV